ncbi:unnamed protein product [Acanthoscelides obtectus]|uniref:Uncharacterized protein n=1 Tax=Acanthoscelides obtectus TaxID=200917 RepID=A0A9P0LBS8_ACAOB|nr:unnamed protein product [Acanthoscelides obtectus]CAK1624039.1 hypothetical protein AOBTE_LOCUS2298 [Acanthoscelides obtectus]
MDEYFTGLHGDLGMLWKQMNGRTEVGGVLYSLYEESISSGRLLNFYSYHPFRVFSRVKHYATLLVTFLC